MIYIMTFNNTTEYNSFINNESDPLYRCPNVSYVVNDDVVYYNPCIQPAPIA